MNGGRVLLLAASLIFASQFPCPGWAGPNGPPVLTPMTASTAPDRLKPIGRFQLIEGKLWAEVYAPTLQTQDGPLPCWTYATVGLRSVGQKEMLLTIKREKGEDASAYDRFLPNLFTTFYQLAQNGQRVDIGGFTQLGKGGTPLLGRADLLGLLYAAPQPIPGLEISPDHLMVLLATERELKLALSLGETRFLSRLGHATRYYPVPPWADRKRPEVYGPEAEERKSLLGKVHCTAVPGVKVRLENRKTASIETQKKTAPPGSGMMVSLPTGRLLLTVSPRGAQSLKKAASDPRHGRAHDREPYLPPGKPGSQPNERLRGWLRISAFHRGLGAGPGGTECGK